jgi:hypothetical protein
MLPSAHDVIGLRQVDGMPHGTGVVGSGVELVRQPFVRRPTGGAKRRHTPNSVHADQRGCRRVSAGERHPRTRSGSTSGPGLDAPALRDLNVVAEPSW